MKSDKSPPGLYACPHLDPSRQQKRAVLQRGDGGSPGEHSPGTRAGQSAAGRVGSLSEAPEGQPLVKITLEVQPGGSRSAAP